MHRVLPVTRHALGKNGPASRNTTLRAVRRYATESSSTTAAPLKKSRGVVRTILVYSTGLAVTVYAVSPAVAFNNERYHAFFSESVPLGEALLEYIEEQGWDRQLRLAFLQTSKPLVTGPATDGVSPKPASPQRTAAKSAKPGGVEEAKDKIADEAQQATKRAVALSQKKASKSKVEEPKLAKEPAASSASSTSKSTDKAKEAAKVLAPSQIQFSPGVESLVRKAEAALAGKSLSELAASTTSYDSPSTPPPEEAKDEREEKDSKSGRVYEAALPIGHEPPPGYSRPKPPAPPQSKGSGDKPVELPLVAPSVADLTASEPIVSHLASTIDNLAGFLKGNPSAATEARQVLDRARDDLKELVHHIERVKDDEQMQLEVKLDEQAREYSLKLLELDMEMQDKLNGQEEAFKEFFDEERRKVIQAYREKLQTELETQREIINQRLKEEVIAQGIEMQRRWIRDVKVSVEQERGGRLAKLDELAANIKRLERVTLDNSNYLDENLRLHHLWSALRSFTAALDSPIRKPFRDELRVLRHVAASRDDPVIATALDTIEKTDVPDIGIEPFSDLLLWFKMSVVPQVSRVALVPEHDAGVLSHLASHFLSYFQFQRQGRVEGNDTLSVLARAQSYLDEKDLDSATRELNQLRGSAKVLLQDWLDAARRRLEVLQALDVVQTQATLASLLVV